MRFEIVYKYSGIFPGARMRDDLLQGGSPGTEGTVSETGW
jgi:hypothetical protein